MNLQCWLIKGCSTSEVIIAASDGPIEPVVYLNDLLKLLVFK